MLLYQRPAARGGSSGGDGDGRRAGRREVAGGRRSLQRPRAAAAVRRSRGRSAGGGPCATCPRHRRCQNGASGSHQRGGPESGQLARLDGAPKVLGVLVWRQVVALVVVPLRDAPAKPADATSVARLLMLTPMINILPNPGQSRPLLSGMPSPQAVDSGSNPLHAREAWMAVGALTGKPAGRGRSALPAAPSGAHAAASAAAPSRSRPPRPPWPTSAPPRPAAAESGSRPCGPAAGPARPAAAA